MIEHVDAGFFRGLALVLCCFLLAVFGATRFLMAPWVVTGPSMEPTLADGDRVLVDVWTYRWRGPIEGEVALLEAPWGEPIVKRVSRCRASACYVLGDNGEESTDSRSFGTVPEQKFRGRVLWRYWPWSRAGRIL